MHNQTTLVHKHNMALEHSMQYLLMLKSSNHTNISALTLVVIFHGSIAMVAKKKATFCFLRKDPLYSDTQSIFYKPLAKPTQSRRLTHLQQNPWSGLLHKWGAHSTETLTSSSSNDKLQALENIILGSGIDTRNIKFSLLAAMNISNPFSGVRKGS